MNAIALLLIGSLTLGQPPASQPAALPATQPAGDQARVVRVTGNVSYAIQPGEWRPAKAGDLLSAGTQIRTQLRSKVVLAFGDDTVVLVERATLASIDQFRRTAEAKQIRLGLGHGAVRAGVAETTLRSDMTIETPTATLSKRGTMVFGMSYEPSQGRFRVFLTREGLVQAFNKLTRQSRLVYPGQYVTQAMARWIEELASDRWVPVVDIWGLTPAELAFATTENTGVAVVEPGGGAELFTLSVREAQGMVSNPALSRAVAAPLVLPRRGPAAIPRPEGNFGTGATLRRK